MSRLRILGRQCRNGRGDLRGGAMVVLGEFRRRTVIRSVTERSATQLFVRILASSNGSGTYATGDGGSSSSGAITGTLGRSRASIVVDGGELGRGTRECTRSGGVGKDIFGGNVAHHGSMGSFGGGSERSGRVVVGSTESGFIGFVVAEASLLSALPLLLAVEAECDDTNGDERTNATDNAAGDGTSVGRRSRAGRTCIAVAIAVSIRAGVAIIVAAVGVGSRAAGGCGGGGRVGGSLSDGGTTLEGDGLCDSRVGGDGSLILVKQTEGDLLSAGSDGGDVGEERSIPLIGECIGVDTVEADLGNLGVRVGDGAEVNAHISGSAGLCRCKGQGKVEIVTRDLGDLNLCCIGELDQRQQGGQKAEARNKVHVEEANKMNGDGDGGVGVVFVKAPG